MKLTGMTVEQLQGLRTKINAAIKTAKVRARVLPPKYRNPEDPQQTWAGRGLRPLWAKKLSKAKLEECRT